MKPTKKSGRRRKQMARKGMHTSVDRNDSEDSDEIGEQEESNTGTETPINPVPVAMKTPSVATYKIIKQGEKGVYQIVREDGTDIVYINFGAMLKSISRDDLTELYRIVMNRYGMDGPEIKCKGLTSLSKRYRMRVEMVFQFDNGHTTFLSGQRTDYPELMNLIPPPHPLLHSESLFKKVNMNYGPMKMRQYIAIMITYMGHNIMDTQTTTDPASPSVSAPKTSLAANARRNNEKALNILLSAIPDRHLLSFHDAVDARSLWKAIKSKI
ncbi:hypothetical protein Tco_1124181 [Tanacetum coccineum]|uniref:Xylulose kinase-1 n=1 Tax=Tanacetum coccineum TaxID=301880 RepID=A0ABQ5J5E0_9ASTR